MNEVRADVTPQPAAVVAALARAQAEIKMLKLRVFVLAMYLDHFGARIGHARP